MYNFFGFFCGGEGVMNNIKKKKNYLLIIYNDNIFTKASKTLVFKPPTPTILNVEEITINSPKKCAEYDQ